MSSTKYTYAISTDTANAVVDSTALTSEIADSAIVTALDYITTNADVLDIWFKDALSAGDQTNLTNVVNAHTGASISPAAIQVQVNEEPAFKHKKLPDGNKLYNRTEGKSFSLSVGVNDALDFNIPWNNAKLTGLEIIGGEIGDKVELKVRDDPSGTISTVADAVLNQFGYGVWVAKDFYRRESQYDADLIKDMKIELEYDSVSAKTIYVNYVLHEVKP